MNSSRARDWTSVSCTGRLILYHWSNKEAWNYTLISQENKYILQISHSLVSDSLWPCGPQHTRPPCPSPTPRACSNSCPSSQWCHSTNLSSVIPFSSCLQSFPALGSFPMCQHFAWGSQSIGASASASVLPMNIQDWVPLGLPVLIFLQSKGLSRVLFNTTVHS